MPSAVRLAALFFGGNNLKTVLFALNGSYSHTSLAVRAIGACLQDAGVETRIVEHSLKDTRLRVLEALCKERADVYGFSVYIWNVTEMLQYASELKALLPHCVTVFGGPEVSFENESFFERYPFVDHIIAGEGEDAFPALCKDLAAGKKIPKIIMAEPYRRFTESGIYYDTVGATPHGLVYYESVRGCPFSCAYCLSSVTQGIRAKAVQRTLDDLKRFEAFDDIRTVKLVDRTFNFDRERAKEIWRALLGDGYTKEYHFEVSAALLDEESFLLLENVPKGKFRLEIGVQSTNPDTVSAISRRLDTEKTLLALRRLNEKKNLHLHADLIAGLPLEDYASFARSFDDVYGICDVLQLGFLKLLRGSRMRAEAERYGIRYSPAPPYTVLATDHISFEELMRLHEIDELNDRFSNSGKFGYTFPWLAKISGSPFRFFEGLSDFAKSHFGVREIARLAQADAFRLLWEYASSLGTVPMEELRERLALDFLLGETRRLPPFLHTDTVRDEESRAYLSRIPAAERAACTVVRFPWLSENPVTVNRIRREILYHNR